MSTPRSRDESARRGAAAPAARAARRSSRVTFDDVREMAVALPGVDEGTSYGTPAFRVRGKLFARLHEDGESLVVRIEIDAREIRMSIDPDAFHITDHYRAHPWMLVRLSRVRRADLRDVLEQSWAIAAPPRLRAARSGETA